MKYYKIDVSNIITQIQPNEESGFLSTSNDIVCGMVDNGDGTFSDPAKTAEELLIIQTDAIKSTIQSHLDATAKTFKFETGMDRAASYAGYTNVFQADATTLATWRSNCWAYAEAEEAKVIAATRTMPTPTEMMAELEIAYPTPVAV